MDDFTILNVPLVDLIHGSFNELIKDMESEVLIERGGSEWLNFVFNPFLNTHLNYPLNDLENVLTLYDSSNDKVDCYVGCFDGVPSGCAIVCSSETYCIVLTMYVEKDFRKLGLAEFMLNYVQSVHENKHLYAFTFPGNKDSKNLYERFGLKTQIMTVG